MRVRHIIALQKLQSTDSGWSTQDMQPRFAPIFPRTLPIRAGWQWRSAKAEADGTQFILVAQCHPARDDWKSFLLIQVDEHWSVVARYEDHSSHRGRHAHTDCRRSAMDIGPQSFDHLARLPPVHRRHRMMQAWTPETFWQEVKRFFRFKEHHGPIFTPEPGSDQT